MHYKCPVCAYDMPYAPTNYNICPSCGTEFGADDVDWSYTELRRNWLRRGAPWFSCTIQRPDNWNPFRQLLSGGYWSLSFKTESGENDEKVTPRLRKQDDLEAKAKAA